jgi:hypothetical protein
MEWSSLQMLIQRLIAEFALKLKLRILDSRMRRGKLCTMNKVITRHSLVFKD